MRFAHLKLDLPKGSTTSRVSQSQTPPKKGGSCCECSIKLYTVNKSNLSVKGHSHLNYYYTFICIWNGSEFLKGFPSCVKGHVWPPKTSCCSIDLSIKTYANYFISTFSLCSFLDALQRHSCWDRVYMIGFLFFRHVKVASL